MINMNDPEEVDARFEEIVQAEGKRAGRAWAQWRRLRTRLADGRITEEEFQAELAKLRNDPQRPRKDA